MKRHQLIQMVVVVALLIGILSDCASVQKGIEEISRAGEKMSSEDKEAALKIAEGVRKSFAEISEEEEYYIGRAVAALILSRYPVLTNNRLTSYVNLVGNAVALYSDRPEIYAGYHFLILDTSEVNALAAPGGFIFITKGLLLRCRNEEMLAAVLAHEIGHVSAKHGLRSIKKSRLIDAFKIIGQEAAKRYGPEEIRNLTTIFEGVLSDIVEALIERGYDRKYEYEADKLAVEFAARIKYEPKGICDFLKTMIEPSQAGSDKGWFRTHPSAEDRIQRLDKQISRLSIPDNEVVSLRLKRFKQATGGL